MTAIGVNYRQMLDALANPVIAADASNRVVYLNPAAGRLLGWPIDELIGQPLAVIQPERFRQAHLDAFQRYLATRVPRIIGHPIRVPASRFQAAALCRDGTEINVELAIAALPASVRSPQALDGDAPLFVASMRDLRERVELEQAPASVRSPQAEEGFFFLSSVSHDLKNPIAAIKGRAQMLKRRLKNLPPAEADRFAQSLDSIESVAVRMTRLISDLVDVAQLRVGQPLDLHYEVIDLMELARGVVAEAQQTTDHHSIQVVTPGPSAGCAGDDGSSTSLSGEWDRSRIERVLTNLLANAIKYSPEGGQILVEVTREESEAGPHALIRVRDKGIGIPADDLPHILQRYHRASNVQGGFEGTGVGLATANQIVEQHHGTISVESQEGSGTTFTVRLPTSREL